MERKKRNIGNILDALVDQDGLKTEVTITLTNQTLLKIVIGMLVSGVAIVVISQMLKNWIPNEQLASIQKEVLQIKQQLK